MRHHASLRAPVTGLLVAAAALTAASCSLVLGIGDPSLDPTGSGGAGGGAAVTTSVSSSVASTTSATSTASASSTGTGEVTYPCSPTNPVCNQVKSDCLAVYDNKGKSSFALRVGQLDFYKPVAFTGNIEKAAFLSSVTMNLPKCNLKGSGTFSWIVKLDPAASTFEIGAAKPPADPHNGYSFVDETITQGGKMFHIAPVSGKATVSADGAIQADTLDSILLPVYINSAATDLLLIPVHKVHILETDTKVSADHNCIGRYNAAGLKEGDGCLPNVDENIDAFINGGKIEGYIALEEADSIIITSFGLNRSLCVLLSNSAGVFGDGGSPAKCKRDGAGKIKFNGDLCIATGMGADATCYDAVSFYAGFAASAVELK